VNTKKFELEQARETIQAQAKELEASQNVQSEMEALWKELEDTRHALALTKADSVQLENSNSRINDELALAVSE
jgi:(p)ppGpp synthase/HD superfamily hydrolase